MLVLFKKSGTGIYVYTKCNVTNVILINYICAYLCFKTVVALLVIFTIMYVFNPLKNSISMFNVFPNAIC